MFTFLTTTPFAWLLMGAVGALVPLIIHLSRSKRTKKMRFSTTRFFTDQFLRSYRMSKIREVLLLICRMALAALLALAMARPLFMPKGKPAFQGGSRAVVLVIDNSASMGYREDNSTLLDKARSAAHELLLGLRQGDSASIVLAGRREAGPEVLFPQPTEKLDDVKQALSQIKVSSLGTDLTGAVERAEAIAGLSGASSKEVVVFSDLQASGWSAGDDAPSKGDVLMTIVRIQPTKRENSAITAVQYSAARPMSGVPFEIKPYVAMQGELAAADVRLSIDGNDVSQRSVEKPNRTIWATPRFHHTFTKGGWHHGFVDVKDDVLSQDNRRWFAFEIVDSVKVLAVNGAPASVPHLDELAYLRAALSAGGNETGPNPIQLDVQSTGEFASIRADDLKKYPLLILANVESVTAGLLERLEDYVDAGGRLLVFLGDKVRASAYNEGLALPARRHSGLLPGRLTKVAGDPAGADTFASVADVDFEHPALSSFADPRFGNLMSVRFKAYWDVESKDAVVLMRSSTGAPLLLEKEFGRGRVVLWTSTVDRDWTNFPVRPTFLPWAHRLIGYLVQESAGRATAYATGDEIPVPFPAESGTTISVKKPDGKEGYPAISRDQPGTLLFTDTAEPGIYSFRRSDQPDRPVLVAVNVPREESNLTGLDEAFTEQLPANASIEDRTERIQGGLQKLFANRPPHLIQYVDDPARIGDMRGSGRGWRFWDVLLILVLLIALFEPWLANRISLRHYGKAKPIADDALGRTSQGAGRLIARESATLPQVEGTAS